MAEPKEITIPVPWGHIAGKSWGDSNDRKVLAVHGKQDNCGAFDGLIQRLRKKYFIIAIDLPGHGLSSHFPAGVPIYFFNYIVAIKKVIDYIKWNRFYFLGHSLGGQFGFFFAALYPESVEKLIVLDHFGPLYCHDSDIVPNLRAMFNDFLKLEEKLGKGKPPVYTYDEALEKLVNRESYLSKEAANVILKRSLIPYETGYTFCMDQRIKLEPFPGFTFSALKEVILQIQCPCLIALSTQRLERYQDLYKDVIETFRSMKNVEIRVIHGGHDMHQNQPEKIVPIVENFLTDMCKL